MVKKLSAASTISHRFAQQGSDPATPDSGFWTMFFRSTGFYLKNNAGVRYLVRAAKNHIFIPAFQMYPSATAGASAVTKREMATNDQNIQTIDFDQTTNEYAEFAVIMPADWNLGTITYEVCWTSAAGTAGTVEWNVQAMSYSDGVALDAAWGTAIEVSDTWIAANSAHFTTESAALTIAGTPGLGDLILFRIFRDATNDTFDADAQLLGVRLMYN